MKWKKEKEMNVLIIHWKKLTSGVTVYGQTVRPRSSAATRFQSRVPCRRTAPPSSNSSHVPHTSITSAPIRTVHVHAPDQSITTTTAGPSNLNFLETKYIELNFFKEKKITTCFEFEILKRGPKIKKKKNSKREFTKPELVMWVGEGKVVWRENQLVLGC